MKESISELQFCIIREKKKIANWKDLIKNHSVPYSETQNQFRINKIIESEEKIKDFNKAILIIDKHL